MNIQLILTRGTTQFRFLKTATGTIVSKWRANQCVKAKAMANDQARAFWIELVLDHGFKRQLTRAEAKAEQAKAQLTLNLNAA